MNTIPLNRERRKMNKKNKTKTFLFLSTVILVFLTFLAVKFLAQEQECDDTSENFTEHFNTTEFKDPTSSVSNWGNGFITLNRLGANFSVANPTAMQFTMGLPV